MTTTPNDPTSFQLLNWRVCPSLNSLTQGNARVRIEPKLMDVLEFLSERPGQVVSKEEIAQAVWPEVFISESVITRAIAGLRRALDDDVRAPRYIETISKRGYRLIAPLERDSRAAQGGAASPIRSGGAAYAVGQWVRGDQFYGRRHQIREILDGNRNGVWLLGGRAIGKTSLLRHLEHLTATEPHGRYFPLFWDLQGSEGPTELERDFHSALADSRQRLEEVGIGLEEIAAEDLFGSLASLRRELHSRGRTLLLLCDEVEQLLQIGAEAPCLLGKLRRALQSPEGVRTVLASSSRLWQLAEPLNETSPFLHGFAPPIYLGRLEDDEARALVRQKQAPGGGLPFSDDTVDAILRRCGNHPYLLQLLCTRLQELGDLERATTAVAADPAVRALLFLDYDLFSELEQQVVTALAKHDGPIEVSKTGLTAEPSAIGSCLVRLERIGVLKNTSHGPAITGEIMRGWLGGRGQKP